MRYVASAFFKGDRIGSAQEVAPLWEEVLLLVDAPDEEAAAHDAAQLARGREHQYKVSRPTTHVLRWTFVKIERVQLLEGALTNGAEIFSRFLRAAEAESLLTPFDDAEDVEKA
jgi:hypothetical protein